MQTGTAKYNIILPVYNERENLPIMIHLLSQYCLPLPDFHVIIVEDNSPDGTLEVARQLQDSYGADFITIIEVRVCDLKHLSRRLTKQ